MHTMVYKAVTVMVQELVHNLHDIWLYILLTLPSIIFKAWLVTENKGKRFTLQAKFISFLFHIFDIFM